jgi:hypothetical protein
MNGDGGEPHGPRVVAATARKYGLIFIAIALCIIAIFLLLAYGGHLLSHAR